MDDFVVCQGGIVADHPLVLTLRLAEPDQRRFERERAALFPEGRTQVGAHVTLFHALPAALRPEVEDELAAVHDVRRPEVRVRGVRSLGRGVAYDLACPWVEQRHQQWRRRWRPHLTRQDDAGLRLHVTVQNKVEPEVARRTLEELGRDLTPWTTEAVALQLWRYDGGPWTHLADGPFAP